MMGILEREREQSETPWTPKVSYKVVHDEVELEVEYCPEAITEYLNLKSQRGNKRGLLQEMMRKAKIPLMASGWKLERSCIDQAEEEEEEDRVNDEDIRPSISKKPRLIEKVKDLKPVYFPVALRDYLLLFKSDISEGQKIKIGSTIDEPCPPSLNSLPNFSFNSETIERGTPKLPISTSNAPNEELTSGSSTLDVVSDVEMGDFSLFENPMVEEEEEEDWVTDEDIRPSISKKPSLIKTVKDLKPVYSPIALRYYLLLFKSDIHEGQKIKIERGTPKLPISTSNAPNEELTYGSSTLDVTDEDLRSSISKKPGLIKKVKDLKPVYSPIALRYYLLLFKSDIHEGQKIKIGKWMAPKITEHLLAVGWSLSYTWKKSRHDRRYNSPKGKHHALLHTACLSLDSEEEEEQCSTSICIDQTGSTIDEPCPPSLNSPPNFSFNSETIKRGTPKLPISTSSAPNEELTSGSSTMDVVSDVEMGDFSLSKAPVLEEEEDWVTSILKKSGLIEKVKDLKPVYSSVALKDYLLLFKSDISEGQKIKIDKWIAPKVMEHLLAVGWSLSYTWKKLRYDRRYNSPKGKRYASLHTACLSLDREIMGLV
ncbi:hypothetical protein AMTR_s00051p00018730 [Amborella trichopoda]|uniref:DUF7028 domain-containing protein n=1 Tax=Amborella trichopoda TaxID=13333 RepID=U5D307_AMBTC|nr:hypothetical protein AMTR_s00051p00018730 [Amborella trichopoda]